MKFIAKRRSIFLHSICPMLVMMVMLLSTACNKPKYPTNFSQEEANWVLAADSSHRWQNLDETDVNKAYIFNTRVDTIYRIGIANDTLDRHGWQFFTSISSEVADSIEVISFPQEETSYWRIASLSVDQLQLTLLGKTKNEASKVLSFTREE